VSQRPCDGAAPWREKCRGGSPAAWGSSTAGEAVRAGGGGAAAVERRALRRPSSRSSSVGLGSDARCGPASSVSLLPSGGGAPPFLPASAARAPSSAGHAHRSSPSLRRARMPSRREVMQFCIPSLLQRQFAFPFASSVGSVSCGAR
jgi:hypothetical protein